jgi:signal transduction histidine kinase
MRADPIVDGSPRSLRAVPQGGPTAKPLDLGDAIQRCVDRYEGSAGGRIVVFVPYRLRAEADPDAVCEVLCALLSNALKFAPPGSPIHVTAISDVNDVVVTVRDAGPGVSSERCSQLLGRANGHGRERGLQKACRQVEGHGGQVWVECAPEGGAAFSFTLPRGGPRPVRPVSA